MKSVVLLGAAAAFAAQTMEELNKALTPMVQTIEVRDSTPFWMKHYSKRAKKKKEMIDFQTRNLEQVILHNFAVEVHQRALELMERDGKVEGKHFAAMKQILAEHEVEINLELPSDGKIVIVKAQ